MTHHKTNWLQLEIFVTKFLQKFRETLDHLKICGIKIYVLADVSSSYCCAFDVYTAKTGDLAEVGQGQRVVLQLTENFYNSGRNITAANFFSSYSLVSQLLSKKLTYVGTVRKIKVPSIGISNPL